MSLQTALDTIHWHECNQCEDGAPAAAAKNDARVLAEAAGWHLSFDGEVACCPVCFTAFVKDLEEASEDQLQA